ncbi:hypothetical protein [Actibacterium sp. XHP0104]|uniref:hypothetical protein n=1 Tax=Actibacterium sp. XHP0104 TaxID=2984335 RepID=UPI0021E9172A|nr:hypothetical protein [Actibacterium sp. XHP0104]MCV2882362.1 hypothetical protein [Actibacterium sp. XHP0104]
MDWFSKIFTSIPCGIADWTQIWGDPLLSGTVFMIGYGLAGVLMLRIAARTVGRERWLWRICGWLFVFQVANTHLDMHALVVSYGRCLARAQGWYQGRHDIQLVVLIGALALAAAIILGGLVVFYRNILGNALLVLGVTVALGLTVVKAINYHHIEHFYVGVFGQFRGADLIELSGVALALIAALLKWRGLRDSVAAAAEK